MGWKRRRQEETEGKGELGDDGDDCDDGLVGDVGERKDEEQCKEKGEGRRRTLGEGEKGGAGMSWLGRSGPSIGLSSNGPG